MAVLASGTEGSSSSSSSSSSSRRHACYDAPPGHRISAGLDLAHTDTHTLRMGACVARCRPTTASWQVPPSPHPLNLLLLQHAHVYAKHLTPSCLPVCLRVLLLLLQNGKTMVDGLDVGNSTWIAADFATVVYRLKLLGFNSVRLPFSFNDLDLPTQ